MAAEQREARLTFHGGRRQQERQLCFPLLVVSKEGGGRRGGHLIWNCIVLFLFFSLRSVLSDMRHPPMIRAGNGVCPQVKASRIEQGLYYVGITGEAHAPSARGDDIRNACSRNRGVVAGWMARQPKTRTALASEGTKRQPTTAADEGGQRRGWASVRRAAVGQQKGQTPRHPPSAIVFGRRGH